MKAFPEDKCWSLLALYFKTSDACMLMESVRCMHLEQGQSTLFMEAPAAFGFLGCNFEDEPDQIELLYFPQGSWVCFRILIGDSWMVSY